MVIKINIKELTDVSSPYSDYFSVTATLELIEDEIVLDEKSVTVTGFRYEADNLKEAVKERLKSDGMEWREQYSRAKVMAEQLEGLEGEL